MDWLKLLPKYWIQHYPTCEEWDKELNRLLDEGPTKFDEYYVYFGNRKVWAENYPYAFGKAEFGPFNGKMPKCKTRIRLKKLVDEQVTLRKEQAIEEYYNEYLYRQSPKKPQTKQHGKNA